VGAAVEQLRAGGVIGRVRQPLSQVASILIGCRSNLGPRHCLRLLGFLSQLRCHQVCKMILKIDDVMAPGSYD
jgi:hypothetical protein